MCIPNRQLDPKARRFTVIGSASFVLGLIPWILREDIPMNRDLVHGFCGFFLGISIAVNLICLRLASRCRASHSASL
jgi:hypothetical protein